MATVGLSLAAAVAAQAAPGDLDTSFGQGGMATVDLKHNAFGNALLVQPDGKIVVAGTAISTFADTTDVVTARFTPDGAPDTSYGQDGASQLDFGENETGYGAALQPDGKILVAGDSTAGSTPSRLLVTRFASNGALDTTFGGGSGKAEPTFGITHSLFGRGMALQANGQIVVGGYWAAGTSYGTLAARLSNAGTPDTTFAGGHTGALEGYDPGVDQTTAAVAVGKDGTVFGAGETFLSIGGPGDFTLSTVNSGESGSTGDDLGGDDQATALVVEPDGKILLAGYTTAHGTLDFAVERYSNSNNFQLDTSFGTSGKEIIDLGGSDAAKAILLQPDGKIVVVGTTTSGSASQIGVVRLLASGQPDTGFGHNGISVVGFGAAKLSGNAAALEPNGDIVVGGTVTPAGGSQKNLVAVRLHGDSSASSGSGGSGSGGGSSGGGGAPGASAPTLSGVSASKTTFRRAGLLPKLNPTRHTQGTLISATVSSAAQLTLTFTKPAAGRRKNGHCSAPGRHNYGGAHCTRHIVVGTFTIAANAGSNKIAFGGKLSPTQKLPPGSYTLTITASAGGATSASSKLGLTIKH